MVSYTEAFQPLGIHPLRDSTDTIRQCAQHLIEGAPDLGEDRDAWLDLLLVSFIEKGLGRNGLTFLYQYPASQAALAKKQFNNEGFLVAQRFELYYQGVELANGYDELIDADEQLQRFQADAEQRAKRGQEAVPHDLHFIAAMQQSGLPDCAGVALGLDRLLQLRHPEYRLPELLAFPIYWN